MRRETLTPVCVWSRSRSCLGRSGAPSLGGRTGGFESAAGGLRRPVQRQGPDRLERALERPVRQSRQAGGADARTSGPSSSRRPTRTCGPTGRSRTASSCSTARAAASAPPRTTATSRCSSTGRSCKGGDSGIYLRGSPQVQIWDTAGPCPAPGRLRRPLQQPEESQQAHEVSPTSPSASGTPSASTWSATR